MSISSKSNIRQLLSVTFIIIRLFVVILLVFLLGTLYIQQVPLKGSAGELFILDNLGDGETITPGKAGLVRRNGIKDAECSSTSSVIIMKKEQRTIQR